MIDQLTTTLNFNSQALLLRGAKHKVIASNIANADTPRYKAADFNFGAALSQATRNSTAGAPGDGSGLSTRAPAGLLLVSSPRHIAADAASGISGSAARLQYRQVSQPSLDGNTVDTDIEQAKFAENSVRYEASLKFLNGQVSTLLTAIKGQ